MIELPQTDCPIHLRSPIKGDESLIYSSWLNSYKQSPENPIKGEGYWRMYKLTINHILNESNTIMAVNPDDHNQIFGYLVYATRDKDLIVHWAYIKQAFRHFKIIKHIVIQLINDLDLNEQIIITAKGVAYEDHKDRFPHDYKPSYIFK